MSDHNVVLAVAAYAASAAAARDLGVLRRAGDGGVAAAVVAKGADGTLRIDQITGADPGMARAGALLGAAFTVLAAPVGIVLLPAIVTTPTQWARVASLVTYYWQNIPQDGLHQMTNLLESSPAALVVVAVDRSPAEIGALLSDATARIIMDGTTDELGDGFDQAVDDASAAG